MSAHYSLLITHYSPSFHATISPSKTMAVCWRCPICSEVSCEDDANAAGRPLACDNCERALLPMETLCAVCDAPLPERWNLGELAPGRRRLTLPPLSGSVGRFTSPARGRDVLPAALVSERDRRG